MMRAPTSQDEAYRWHRDAVAGRLVMIVNEEPQCGWYRRTLVKGGVMVPVRIWIDTPQGAIDEAGELVDQPVMRCEVNDRAADPFEQWSWVADDPITEIEFDYLTKRNRWAGWYAPEDPAANPRKPVDWLTAPTLF